MGCGSSSTSVETFKNPEENKNYRTQKTPSRHSSATSAISSQRSEKKQKTKRKSSASSSASSKSINSRRQKQEYQESGLLKNASTRSLNSQVNENTPIEPLAVHDENENEEHKTEKNIANFENESNDDIDEKLLEARRQHEELQKQTFITGHPEDEIRSENVEENVSKSVTERHEEIAKRKEEKRAQFDPEKLEEDEINSKNPVPLLFPSEMENEDKNAQYTIDDIVEHNGEIAGLDWFKYGKKVYSWKKMQCIIQDRTNQFITINAKNYYSPVYTYPIYIARYNGVSRKELAKVLPYCQVGICIEVPRDQYLARMKQSAENVLEEDTGTEYFRDFKNQLNRWLADYPMNKVYNDLQETKSDPNEVAFPLPADIQSDPTVLRKWIEAWVEFDCEVPEEGAWRLIALLKEDWGDTQEVFANAIQVVHGKEGTEPFNMDIDGDVAWVEIELDLFKNDTTTESQEMVWKKRATRTNLNDPVWMKQRREELGEILKKRYEERQKEYHVENFLNFAEALEQHWEEFQTLCLKEFVPPVRKIRNTADIQPETDKLTYNNGGEMTEEAGSADNRLVLDHENDGDGVGSFGNNVRAGSRSSAHNSADVERVGSPNKAESEQADSAENRLVINHQHSDHSLDGIQNGDADQIPTLEAMDSGLDLNSNDQLDHGHADNDSENGRMNGDSIQLTDRPETDGTEKSVKTDT